jgi:hypothetical protein
VVIGAAALCLLVRAGITLAGMWRTRSAPIPPSGAVPRIAWRMSGILPFLFLAVPAIAILGIVLSPPPFVEVPPGIRAAFGLLTAAAAISALLPIGAAAALRERAWPRRRRWFFAVYACTTLGLAWLLTYWSIVPGGL